MEEEHKFDLRFAKQEIFNWTKWYFKKNSKKKTTIKLRCFSGGEEIFWKYYLELSIDGKQKFRTRITREAYDTLNLDPNLPRTHYIQVDFTTLKSIN
jgi:hypothetical protein